MALRPTKKREMILATLRHQHGTLTAKEIHARLPEIDLATIYRNLDLFEKEKLIRPVHLGKGEKEYEFQHEPHHHAICGKCHRIIHFTAPDKKIEKLLGLVDFDIDEIEVTVHGTCKKDH